MHRPVSLVIRRLVRDVAAAAAAAATTKLQFPTTGVRLYISIEWRIDCRHSFHGVVVVDVCGLGNACGANNGMVNLK